MRWKTAGWFPFIMLYAALARSATAQALPDLTVVSLSGPTVAGAAQPITVTSIVANAGTTASNWSCRIYLSPTANVSTNDTILWNLGPYALFAERSTVTNVTTVTIPIDTDPTPHYLGAIIDYDNTVVESNEANNALASGPLGIVGPDLAALSVTGPPVAGVGRVVTLTNRLANTAIGAAKDYSYRIYLSIDTTITTNDTLLQPKSNLGLFPAQTAFTNRDAVTIPVTASTGTFYFGVIINYEGTAAESNTANNVTVSGPVALLGPDLTVLSVGGPTNVGTGQTLTLTNVLANIGIGPAGNYGYRIYLSTDATITTNDTLLVPKSSTGLSAQTVVTNLDVVLIPDTVSAGTYYFGVLIDFNNAVVESTKTNNSLASGPVQVGIGPDLTILSVNGPTNAGTGQTLTLTNVVANVGIGASKVCPYAVYLSSDAVITTNDTLLVPKETSALAAQAVVTNLDVVLIPSAASTGTYYFGVVLNPYQTIAEATATNNSRASTPVVIGFGPDLTVLSVAGPAMSGPSQSLTVTSRVTNAGLGAVNSWNYRIYLCTNAQVATNDVVLATRSGSQGLPAGTAITNADVVAIPAATASGTYQFGVIIDYNNAVAEANEANNALVSSSVAVGPLFTGIRWQANSALLDIAGLIAAGLYSIEYSTSLADTNAWTTGSTFSATGPSTNYLDAASTSVTFRTYRLEQR